MSGRLHEDFGREELPGPGSPRAFGLLMAVALPLLAWLWLRAWLPWALGAGALFAALALLLPRWLEPLNRAWHRLGLLLGRLVSPLVLGLVFFGVVAPVGLLRRLFGRHSLALRFEPGARSYWIERDPPGPEPAQLPRQY